jgi:CheY-like chemotaxis protein
MPAHTILVADDAPLFCELESLILARSGRVVTAANAREALLVAKRERPSVAVLDFDLPDLPGDALFRAFRREWPELPIIAITSDGDPEQRASAVRSGACDVLSKPIDRVSLVQAVDRIVRFTEIRGLARVDLASPVRVEVGREEHSGIGRNLSRGGMFIESAWAPPAAEVRVHFRLPAVAEGLSPTARVMWRRGTPGPAPFGIGVQFLSLDRRSSERIDAFVYEYAPMRSDPVRPGAYLTMR